jgi:hypothetical protein
VEVGEDSVVDVVVDLVVVAEVVDVVPMAVIVTISMLVLLLNLFVPIELPIINLVVKYKIACGAFSHPCEGDMVCKATLGDRVPYFNAPIFLENKTPIGKVDEIFGPLNDYVALFFINFPFVNCLLVVYGQDTGRHSRCLLQARR